MSAYRQTMGAAVLLAAVCVLGVPGRSLAQAQAQPPEPARGFVVVTGGSMSAAPAFSERRVFPFYAEDGTSDAVYGKKGRQVFEVGGGVRVWRQLFVGAAYGMSSHRHAANLQGSLPHPFVFGAPRALEGAATGLERRESVVHVPVMWRLRATSRLDVMVFGGPSFISATQDLVDSLEFTETYPYDTAVFTGAKVVERSVTSLVPHGGVALSYRLFSRIGAGIQIRRAGTTADFEMATGRVIRSRVGGTQTTGGVWLGF